MSAAAAVLAERQRALEARCGEVARRTRKALSAAPASTSRRGQVAASSVGQRTPMLRKKAHASASTKRTASDDHQNVHELLEPWSNELTSPDYNPFADAQYQTWKM